MKRNFVLLIAFIFLSGCAKLTHLQELLTLKSYSDDQALQDRYIERQDRQFEELLQTVQGKKGLSEYPTKTSFMRHFGEPIYIKAMEKNGQVLEQWLYRYQMKYFESDKVYVYFDSQGNLVDWIYVPALEKEIS